MLLALTITSGSTLVPLVGASAQDAGSSYDRQRREQRRKDRVRSAIVISTLGPQAAGGVVATSVVKKKRMERERRNYCLDRYGNYDQKTDSYRDDRGQWRRCD